MDRDWRAAVRPSQQLNKRKAYETTRTCCVTLALAAQYFVMIYDGKNLENMYATCNSQLAAQLKRSCESAGLKQEGRHECVSTAFYACLLPRRGHRPA